MSVFPPRALYGQQQGEVKLIRDATRPRSRVYRRTHADMIGSAAAMSTDELR
jgi:hypothetical protein